MQKKKKKKHEKTESKTEKRDQETIFYRFIGFQKAKVLSFKKHSRNI